MILVLKENVAVIGFINAPYQAYENDGTVSVEVGVLGATVLEKEVTVILSYTDGSAFG